MILIYMLLVALALTLPLLLAFRRPRNLSERREAAMALHRAQLAELERDLAEGRISETEHEGAKLEIERRLLAADSMPTQATGGSAKLLLIVTMIALPVGGFALYLPGSTPGVPSEPHAQWQAQQAAQDKQLDKLISLLRAHLTVTDPSSSDASEGQAYLAEALTEKAGSITPEALSLFKQSLANAPKGSNWRELDQQRILQAKEEGLR
ncbi:c-type cytochrome biogenesis protein CcmI [Acidocella aminolytica]|jgi:cytochrome c-type biogenesis protein CcmH|uniref:Cytochrome c-type biogenesis protein CcmH/CycH n=1 Tax=Acidocella aminolytica 101 = DSM 11237 TaxID=1120923 RepID=A0A0D6PAA7_9PROT|nr:c-type cytochrome biogenesis protein CcmI [Acidocella aminolytica]GAN78675.1 cytochrome c-type biogenesis protein CcmH/CycH [Acidocella aminolytica 101 = DSM 11237]GBQ36651.1 cytochrome c biogenesis factor [Acidocella aminolytica 101 = DSM 11237]SHE45051.1 cytochrome c-type biogenesis protein CcmH [Acidocella aminolytica 101 = DSM 11237]